MVSVIRSELCEEQSGPLPGVPAFRPCQYKQLITSGQSVFSDIQPADYNHIKIKMRFSIVAVVLLLAISAVLCDNRDWHIGADSVNPRGTVVHGHANIPLHQGSDGRMVGNVHGSRVIGGPYNRKQTVGGGVGYEGRNGVRGGVDVTHSRGQGNTVMGTISGRF